MEVSYFFCFLSLLVRMLFLSRLGGVGGCVAMFPSSLYKSEGLVQSRRFRFYGHTLKVSSCLLFDR